MRHLEFDCVPLFLPLTPCHSQAVVSGLDVQILLTAEQEATRSVTKQTVSFGMIPYYLRLYANCTISVVPI